MVTKTPSCTCLKSCYLSLLQFYKRTEQFTTFGLQFAGLTLFYRPISVSQCLYALHTSAQMVTRILSISLSHTHVHTYTPMYTYLHTTSSLLIVTLFVDRCVRTYSLPCLPHLGPFKTPIFQPCLGKQ